MSERPPILELHSHRHGVTDITHWVTALSWMHSVEQPWSTINASLMIPRRRWRRTMPHPGDWLVVRDANDNHALAWGYVSDRQTGIAMAEGGHVATDQTNVSAISWFALLGRAQVVAAAVGKGVGTHISVRELLGRQGAWRAILGAVEGIQRELVNAIGTDASGNVTGTTRDVRVDPGSALREVMAELPRVLLPPTMTTGSETGDFIREAVRVAHDANSARAYAPERPVERVPGPTLQGLQTSFNSLTSGASVLDLIMGTFSADNNLVELFPSLEEPGPPGLAGDPGFNPAFRRTRDKLAAKVAALLDEQWLRVDEVRRSIFGRALPLIDEAVKRLSGNDIYSSSEARDLRFQIEQETKRAAKAATGKASPASHTAAALGRNPVLIYRVKPWRTEPLTEGARGITGRQTQTGRLVTRADTSATIGVSVKDRLDATLFEGRSWFSERGPRLEQDQVYSVTMSVSDADHVNAVAVGLPWEAGNQWAVWHAAGMPFISPAKVERRGLRMYTPQWPFLPPFDPEVTGPRGEIIRKANRRNFVRNMYTVGAQATMYMANADRFERGTVAAHYSPHVRHGDTIVVELPGDTPGTSVLSAYVDSVEHTFSVGENGVVVAHTNITYSRGLLDERTRGVPATALQGVGGTL